MSNCIVRTKNCERSGTVLSSPSQSLEFWTETQVSATLLTVYVMQPG